MRRCDGRRAQECEGGEESQGEVASEVRIWRGVRYCKARGRMCGTERTTVWSEELSKRCWKKSAQGGR